MERELASLIAYKGQKLFFEYGLTQLDNIMNVDMFVSVFAFSCLFCQIVRGVQTLYM